MLAQLMAKCLARIPNPIVQDATLPTVNPATPRCGAKVPMQKEQRGKPLLPIERGKNFLLPFLALYPVDEIEMEGLRLWIGQGCPQIVYKPISHTGYRWRI